MLDSNESIGGFTSGELQVASFWVRHRLALRRAAYATLTVLSFLAWGYAIAGILDAYAISYPRESRITRQIALNQQLLASLETDRPQDVSSSEVSVFQSTGVNRYDLMVEVSNPNPQWWVEFNYHFNLSGEDTPLRTGYVLPQTTGVMTELGYTPKMRGGRLATLVVDNVRWHRMDPMLAGSDYKMFAARRSDLVFDTITYDTNITIGTKRVGQSTFTLTNRGSFGYWNVDLIVRLYRGGSIVAINKITISHLSPGEKRTIQTVWLDNLPGVTKTEIIPQVNLLDPSSYLPTQYFQ